MTEQQHHHEQHNTQPKYDDDNAPITFSEQDILPVKTAVTFALVALVALFFMVSDALVASGQMPIDKASQKTGVQIDIQ